MSNNNEQERNDARMIIPLLLVRKKGTVEVPSVIDWSKVDLSKCYVTDAKSALCDIMPSDGLMLAPVNCDM